MNSASFSHYIITSQLYQRVGLLMTSSSLSEVLVSLVTLLWLSTINLIWFYVRLYHKSRPPGRQTVGNKILQNFTETIRLIFFSLLERLSRTSSALLPISSVSTPSSPPPSSSSLHPRSCPPPPWSLYPWPCWVTSHFILIVTKLQYN